MKRMFITAIFLIVFGLGFLTGGYHARSYMTHKVVEAETGEMISWTLLLHVHNGLIVIGTQCPHLTSVECAAVINTIQARLHTLIEENLPDKWKRVIEEYRRDSLPVPIEPPTEKKKQGTIT